MRQLVTLGCVVTFVAVLASCAGEVTGQSEPGGSPIVSTPTDTAPAPAPSLEPQAPDIAASESPAPVDEPEPATPERQEMSLDQTFAAMLDALAADGEEGLRPFLESPDAGDMWSLADWDWTGGPCAEGGPGESACVGYFVKDGMEMENIFGFENVDDQWLLVESWVAWE